MHVGGTALESERTSPPLKCEVHGVCGQELLVLRGLLGRGDLREVRSKGALGKEVQGLGEGHVQTMESGPSGGRGRTEQGGLRG